MYRRPITNYSVNIQNYNLNRHYSQNIQNESLYNEMKNDRLNIGK